MSAVAYDTGASGSRTWTDRASVAAPIPPLGPLSDEQREYLRGRGLRKTTIRRYGLASVGRAIALPVLEAGQVVNAVIHRHWWQVRYEAVRGRPAALYPDLPSGAGVVLVAGMFDALVARQYGLPAVTTTCGAVLPRALAERLGGRDVAVTFDSGEERQADRAVGMLIEAGAFAWSVHLPLPPGGDVADWYVREGRSHRELVGLIRAGRQA